MEVVTADVTDPASYADLGLTDGSLEAVVINAGISGARHQSADRASAEEVAEVMMTNAFGPARAGRALLPKLKQGGTLAFMSSLMGSVADSSGGYELYRSSKAALNMLAKGIAEQKARVRDGKFSRSTPAGCRPTWRSERDAYRAQSVAASPM